MTVDFPVPAAPTRQKERKGIAAPRGAALVRRSKQLELFHWLRLEQLLFLLLEVRRMLMIGLLSFCFSFSLTICVGNRLKSLINHKSYHGCIFTRLKICAKNSKCFCWVFPPITTKKSLHLRLLAYRHISEVEHVSNDNGNHGTPVDLLLLDYSQSKYQCQSRC